MATKIPVCVSKKRVARCFTDDNGKEYQVAYFDGYPFGDRMLEGVMFQAKLRKDGFLEVRVAKDSSIYFKQLNMEKWTKEALKYAIGNDIFNETEAGGNDLAFDNLKIDTSNAMSIPVTSVTSFLDSITKGS